MTQQSLYEQIIDYANRANPYPLYAQLRQTPITRQSDGSYVVSTYREIISFFHDPRIGSDFRKRFPQKENEPALSNNQEPAAENPGGDAGTEAAGSKRSSEAAVAPSFIGQDPPEHDKLRRQATWPFGPPHTPGRVAGMEPQLLRLVNQQIDTMQGKNQSISLRTSPILSQ